MFKNINHNQDDKDKQSSYDADQVVAITHSHSHDCHGPKSSSSGKPLDIKTQPQDSASPQKTDAGNDLGGQACRVGTVFRADIDGEDHS